MLNVAVLMGRIVADPELKHTRGDVAKTTFSLAVGRDFGKKNEEKETDFIDIIAWRNTADFICKYFRKGSLVIVEGSIQTSPYTDSEGNKRKSFEIVASDVHFAGDYNKRDSEKSQSAT